MKTKVYLTVDTENSMGGAWSDPSLAPVPSDRRIFCFINGVDHGVGWICNQLDRYGFKATFFSEVFASKVLGDGDARSWIEFLLSRGQDVQLHTHLNYLYYARRFVSLNEREQRTDDLARLESPARAEVLDEACDLFSRFVGKQPLAFRAGNWVCNAELLKDLVSKGILLDSSFNFALKGKGSFDDLDLSVNKLQLIDSLYELPVTMARQSFPDFRLPDGLRPLDPTSMSFPEFKAIFVQSREALAPYIVIVFHCFSFVKSKNGQFTHLVPNATVQKRFLDVLSYLAKNSDQFEVATLGELATELGKSRVSSDDGGFIPELGFLKPFTRNLGQVYERLRVF